jgi:hypothetical protein
MWCCARTQPNREHFASSELELGRRGYEVYSPRASSAAAARSRSSVHTVRQLHLRSDRGSLAGMTPIGARALSPCCLQPTAPRAPI